MVSPPANASRSVIRNFVRHYSAPADSAIPSSKAKYVPTSGTYPKGFLVSATHVGIKASNKSRPDLAFIVSETPANAAAVFTTNKFQAAPVQISREILRARQGSGIRSIIINSGCANAVTGTGGLEDAKAMSDAATNCYPDTRDSSSTVPNSLVMSTGVIGQRLPIQKILSKVPTAHSTLSSSHSSWLSTAKAIMTTDTFPKLLSTTFTLPSHPSTTYSLAGLTKGAGMIHPNMATLLGILCTDCSISPSALQTLLTSAVKDSFNSISIDGDTSTNDTIAILANGAASSAGSSKLSRSPPIPDDPSNLDYQALQVALTTFAQRLSHLVVRDGEGATKFINIRIRNALTSNDAHLIAASIARSPLVKTALYGRDANWGRILCAIGYTQGLSSSDSIVPEKTSVSFHPAEGTELASAGKGELKLLVNGEPAGVDEERAARFLKEEDLVIDVDLGTGGTEGTEYWTCDLSHEYVTINGDYRT